MKAADVRTAVDTWKVGNPKIQAGLMTKCPGGAGGRTTGSCIKQYSPRPDCCCPVGELWDASLQACSKCAECPEKVDACSWESLNANFGSGFTQDGKGMENIDKCRQVQAAMLALSHSKDGTEESTFTKNGWQQLCSQVSSKADVQKILNAQLGPPDPLPFEKIYPLVYIKRRGKTFTTLPGVSGTWYLAQKQFPLKFAMTMLGVPLCTDPATRQKCLEGFEDRTWVWVNSHPEVRHVVIETTGFGARSRGSFGAFSAISDIVEAFDLLGLHQFKRFFDRTKCDTTAVGSNTGGGMAQFLSVVGSRPGNEFLSAMATLLGRPIHAVAALLKGGPVAFARSVAETLGVISKQQVTHITDKIYKAQRLWPGYRIILRGFSLGGSLSMLASMLYYESYKNSMGDSLAKIVTYAEGSFGVKDLYRRGGAEGKWYNKLSPRHNSVRGGNRLTNAIMNGYTINLQSPNVNTELSFITNYLTEGDIVGCLGGKHIGKVKIRPIKYDAAHLHEHTFFSCKSGMFDNVEKWMHIFLNQRSMDEVLAVADPPVGYSLPWWEGRRNHAQSDPDTDEGTEAFYKETDLGPAAVVHHPLEPCCKDGKDVDYCACPGCGNAIGRIDSGDYATRCPHGENSNGGARPAEYSTGYAWNDAEEKRRSEGGPREPLLDRV